MSLVWNASTNITYPFVIEDGFYSISDLNYLLQKFCILNDLYAINADSQFVYFCSLLTNASAYAAQINCATLPTSAQATTLGYTKPAGATWDWPVSAKSVQFIIPSTQFGNLLGMVPATYPPTILAIDSQHLSSKTPQIQPTNSITIGCNFD